MWDVLKSSIKKKFIKVNFCSEFNFIDKVDTKVQTCLWKDSRGMGVVIKAENCGKIIAD